MEDLAGSAEQVAALMRLLTSTGGLRLKFRITAGAGAADPDGFERRDIYVECKGADSGLLLENEGELLRSLEHIAAKILRLEPEEHDRISFDAEGFKAERVRELRAAAETAIDQVKNTSQPYSFMAMNSRERRMLHVILRDTGLQTASTGEGGRRSVVLYPEGFQIPPDEPERRERPRPGGRERPRTGGRSRY